jgi:hypothetical protein
MNKKNFINERIPIRDLIKVGLLNKNDSYDDIERKICKYFGLKNIFEYDHIMDMDIHVKADIKTFSIN